jgi:hypothetical protein
MRKIELGGITDGRIRVFRQFTEHEKEILTRRKIEGLEILHIKETKVLAIETWIEYWIDKDKVREDDIRYQIQQSIRNA